MSADREVCRQPYVVAETGMCTVCHRQAGHDKGPWATAHARVGRKNGEPVWIQMGAEPAPSAPSSAPADGGAE